MAEDVKGCCMEMCPEKEMKWREKQGLLHQFEICKGTEHLPRPKADSKKIIKEFKRSAAGQKSPKPQDLRPFPVLLKTVNYLMEKIVTKNDIAWSIVYEFTADRLRAIRQDMVIQQMKNEECIPILEKIVRFYVYSSFRLQHKPKSVFDSHLNNIHLQECLKRLLVLYKEVKEKEVLKNRAEMETIYILHNLGSTEALSHSYHLPLLIRTDPNMKLANEISLAYRHWNFIRMLRLIRKLPFLISCSVYQHFEEIRRHSLQVMNIAYSSKNCQFPIEKLREWLMYNDDNLVKDVCKYYGIAVNGNFVCFSKGSFDSQIKTFSLVQENSLQEKAKKIDLISVLNGVS